MRAVRVMCIEEPLGARVLSKPIAVQALSNTRADRWHRISFCVRLTGH